MPKVTSIIVTFNRAHFLGKAIQSVLDQTYPDLELLVLDNSSTDGTSDLVKSFTDPRLRYLRHLPCSIAESRNLGLEAATGEFIAYLDDDDEWLPQKIEKQLDGFAQGSADLGLVYGGFVRIDSDDREFQTHVPVLKGKVLIDLLWQKDAFTGSASNPLMKTSVVRELGGYWGTLPTSEDWELYLRLAEKYQVDYVPDVVVKIRSHRGPRLGDRVGDASAVEEMVLRRYEAQMDRHLRSFYLQKIGGKLCRTGSAQEGRRQIRAAIKTYPFNLLAYAQYAASFTGGSVYQRAHWLYKRLT